MNAPEARVIGPTPPAKSDRWHLFLFLATIVHVAVLFGCPNITVPPRISQQLVKVTETVCFLLLPFICSLFLLFRYRTLSERVISYGSLLVSLLWLWLAVSLISGALKGP
jgi:hypothetical protein